MPATMASSVMVANGYMALTMKVQPSHISTHSTYVAKFIPEVATGARLKLCKLMGAR